MSQLVKLEWGKINRQKLVIIMGVIYTLILVLTGVVLMGIQNDKGFADFVREMQLPIGKQASWAVIVGTMGPLFMTAFGLLFEGYLVGEIIINEFRQKTIYHLFTYPFKRSTILYTKIVIVFIISFIFQFVGIISLLLPIKLMTAILGVTYQLSLNLLLSICVQSLLLSLVGLLPVTIGMIKQSNIMSYVTALVLAQIFGNSFMMQMRNASLAVYLPIMLIGFIVLVSLMITGKRVEKMDIY